MPYASWAALQGWGRSERGTSLSPFARGEPHEADGRTGVRMGRLMGMLRNTLTFVPDAKFNPYSDNVLVKFWIVSFFFVAVLWPFIGGLPALNAAPGLAMGLMLIATIFFNLSRLPDCAHIDCFVKVIAFIFFALIFAPAVVFVSLSIVIDKLSTPTFPVLFSGFELFYRYWIVPALLTFAVLSIGAMKSVVRPGGRT